MARETAQYDLSDAEKRDLIKLIEQGKPLPEKYRFLLFADKREVELVWNGKSREVCTAILPFQTLEHIDEPRKEQREQAELGFDMGGRQIKGWTNKLIWGDNKLILSSLKSGALRRQIEEAGGLKLIYIDPPFDVGADFSMDIEIGGETFHKEPNLLEQIAYRDTWGRGADSFIAMIYERLILMRDLMHSEGSIYVHMMPTVAPFIELAVAEVFGRDRMLGSIVWQRATAHGNAGVRYAAVTDRIISATKTDRYIWNKPYQPYSEEYKESHYSSIEPGTGRRFTLRDLTASMSRASNSQIYEWRGVRPVGSRCWAYIESRMEELYAAGKIVFTSGAMPRMKLYLDEMPGVPATDLWSDISPLNSQAREDTQYPTQKPEALLERILIASTNPDDLVADFFGGSGTTAAVAEKLGRKWIATDLGKFGIHTTRKRLIQVQRELKSSGKPFRTFEVLNLGRYERQAYLNVAGRLSGKKKEQALARKEQEFRDLILKAYRAEPLPDTGFFHGKNGGRLVVVGPINLPVGRLFVEEVVTECRKRGASRVDVLAFEFEMGLFPAVLDEAKQKGIDLAPKTIPPEVFDKRAVEKGQVRFHDVAYIEVTPRFDKKDKLTVAVELTDFSVYYSQGLADAIAADLKEGKSEVVCEQGHLWKVSKDKEGVIRRDKLTKQWTDWVDYWAVDFNYESCKEIIKVPRGTDLGGVQGFLPGQEPSQRELELPAEDFEERWTGAYIFENEWQSFRTRQNRDLELTTATHTYDKPGRYIVAVKVIDIFGNDTMTLMSITGG
jgi:site-specific DNA-methyltransferase (adenine-specific)/adenine-specific DNA-methyltransferase